MATLGSQKPLSVCSWFCTSKPCYALLLWSPQSEWKVFSKNLPNEGIPKSSALLRSFAVGTLSSPTLWTARLASPASDSTDPQRSQGWSRTNRIGQGAKTDKSDIGSMCGTRTLRSGLLASLLGARKLLRAPGRTTRNKKLLGAKGIATRSKEATRGIPDTVLPCSAMLRPPGLLNLQESHGWVRGHQNQSIMAFYAHLVGRWPVKRFQRTLVWPWRFGWGSSFPFTSIVFYQSASHSCVPLANSERKRRPTVVVCKLQWPSQFRLWVDTWSLLRNNYILLLARHLHLRSKDATRGSWHRY